MKHKIILGIAVFTFFSCVEQTNKTTGSNSKSDTNSLNQINNMKESDIVSIDSLVKIASTSGKQEDLTILWEATLNLPEWHFLTKNRENVQDRQPFIGIIDGKPWVFVFTDRKTAQEYGTHSGNSGFTDKDGSVMIISQKTEKAIEYILSLQKHGVYGIRINELNGWFSPIENLPAIIGYTKSK